MRLVISLLIILFFFKMTVAQNNTSILTVSFEELEQLIKPKNDTLIVVNFWATWCAPCIEELPYFEKLNQKYKDKKFKMYLVSLDFKRSKESRLIPFVAKNQLKAEVVHLYEPNANSWIDKIDPSWSGAIPATIFIKGENTTFHEGGLTEKELKDIVNNFF